MNTDSKPILMKGEMVKAILGGKKKQTRRVVEFPFYLSPITLADRKTFANASRYPISDKEIPGEQCFVQEDGNIFAMRCPYGKPNNFLWVRETCKAEELESGLDGVRYLADDYFRPIENSRESADAWMKLNSYRKKRGATVPSIHMPRWASRITLLIKDIRVERLQDISQKDIEKEGLWYIFEEYREQQTIWRDCKEAIQKNRIKYFRKLWESINGDGSWDENPWLWVIEFELILKNIDEATK